MFKQKLIIFTVMAIIAIVGSNSVLARGKREPKRSTFKVRVENVADASGLLAQDGTKYPFALSPGFFITSSKTSQLFEGGKKASRQLEAQAEDGDPGLFYKRFLTKVGSLYTGVFNMPVGKDIASPIFSGEAFEFEVNGAAGMKLDLAFMFGQSNDLFYAPDTAIDLFDANGSPVTGDVTRLFKLWDAGTEVNQAPGIGADQGPRQKGPNSGASENGVVKLVNDGFAYPDTKDVLRVTITVQ